ncbi:TrbC/VirB2 family protein [Proteus mirabilis]|uniref:Conjugal transfer protein TrbC n=2 Tax=Morganellaceae TaxID=1903414 RepID=A0A346H4V8_PROST|nr:MULTISPECIES: TrbC/VirB2 family protein [Enterobacterales]EFK5576954.1 conjugal transfer protein TrbC [Escherichia coli]EJG2204904.1 TrbC/VirB2 family protein [Morganella morganii]EKX8998698.1 TrbC/VirB2 family protein [Citrobacter freundii]HBD3039816.1 TrbC/VirB2 family protein [Citrobacter koseri]HDN0768246.1 TrbC/VirB2 family protein [Staphylococcus aureus]
MLEKYYYSQSKLTQQLIVLGALLLVCMLLSSHAMAGQTQGLPWESPLEKIKNSITGPVAGAISFLGICVAGMMLIWGGEMSDFTKRIVYVVLVISIILGASVVINMWQGNGALIPLSMV